MVVCAKNRAQSLHQILKQIQSEVPYKNLIIIFGSSDDGTQEVAKRFTSNVFWDGDEGLGAARNLGIRKSSSEIVAMIDTDVILTKGWYHQLIRHFYDPKTAVAIGTCIYGYGCKPLESYWRYLQKNDTVNFGCHNTMFNRQILLEIGNFDRKILGAGEDYDLYLRFLAAGYKWIWDKKASVYHPMSLFEYLHHVRWWAQGRPRIQEIVKAGSGRSLVRIYSRQAFLVLSCT